MTSDLLAVTTVALLTICQEFWEPGMRWVVQIMIPAQAALCWDNPPLIKGHLFSPSRLHCQEEPDVSTLLQSVTSLRILTWIIYGWAEVVTLYEPPSWCMA